VLPLPVGLGSEGPPTEMPLVWRERKAILSLQGSQCKRCNTPVYPPQIVCPNPECGAVGEMRNYSFSDKKGVVFSYTVDRLAPCLDPPLMFGVIQFDGGGRFMFDIIDFDADSLKVGMPVRMSFRKKYVDESHGMHGYFWKAVPLREP
jgi:hydroxymethylglutaryl-CoA synthase